MMPKNNIRSFRFSDEVEEILQSCDGNNLSEKFSWLVIDAYKAVPAAKAERDMLFKDCEELRAKKRKLLSELYSLDSLNSQKKWISTASENYVCAMQALQKKLEGTAAVE